MDASELLENVKEIIPLYYVERDVINRFIYPITHRRVTRRGRVKSPSISSLMVLQHRCVYRAQTTRK